MGSRQRIKRNERIHPGLDDKIILGWNALAVKAIAKASIVLKDDGYRQLAITAYKFLMSSYRVDKTGYKMQHTWKKEVSKYPAFLDDYAYLIDAGITMYELTFSTNYLIEAKGFCNHVIENFTDDEGLFFYYTGRGQDDIITRKKELYDGAIPSGNAVMASNLHKLSIIFDEGTWHSQAENMVLAVAEAIVKYPTSFGIWASLLQQKINGSKEIAVVGKGAVNSAVSIQAGYYIPDKIIMVSETGDEDFPLLKNKRGGNFIQIFLCRNYICTTPFTSAEALINEIIKR